MKSTDFEIQRPFGTHWFYFDADQYMGPYDAVEIERLISMNLLDQTAQIWNPTLRYWSDLPDARAFLLQLVQSKSAAQSSQSHLVKVPEESAVPLLQNSPETPPDPHNIPLGQIQQQFAQVSFG
jgi:hypothetical protein